MIKKRQIGDQIDDHNKGEIRFQPEACRAEALRQTPGEWLFSDSSSRSGSAGTGECLLEPTPSVIASEQSPHYYRQRSQSSARRQN
jgi:hypothetical protein